MPFKPADRKNGLKLRMALFGPSGCGKTYSSLAIATGLGGTIAVIDTEHNRACAFSDDFTFDHCFLERFSPEDYIKAIKEAAEQEYDNLIIDSFSHSWDGAGGMLDLHSEMERQSGMNSFTAWNPIMPKFRKLLSFILQYPGNVIVTMRTKTAYAMETISSGEKAGKSIIKKLGLAPIQKDSTEYEFSATFSLDMVHRATCHKDDSHIFEPGIKHIPSVRTGEAYRDWLEGIPGKDIRDKLIEEEIIIVKK